VYPESHLSFLANVYNQKARDFYHRHGVQLIDAAYEAHEERRSAGDDHQALPALLLQPVPKQAKGVTGVRTKVAPMQLIHGDEVLTLKFDCKPCEMHVIGKMKGHIIDLPTPGSAVAQVVGHISPEDLLKTIPRAPH
jgi:putative protease